MSQAVAAKDQSSTNGPEVDFAVSVPASPVTSSRVQAINADRFVEKPSIARANVAACAETPYGRSKYAQAHSDYTVLQQHVLFWDRDQDGQIFPWDTYIGFRELGFNILFSLIAMFIINFNFSYPTRMRYTYLPDPFFRVYVSSIHKAKHGSDTGIYDNEGRFIPQKFEDLFAKFDVDGKGALTLGELFTLLHAQRVAADPFGWFAGVFEMGTMWLMLQKDGKVEKEDLRQVYDGSIFWRIRENRRSGQGWNQGFGIGGDGFIGGTKFTGQ